MSRKKSAARKMWFKRNSKVLTRKIRHNSYHTLKFIKHIPNARKNREEAVKEGNAKNIFILSNNFLEGLIKHCKFMFDNVLYCATIEKRILKNLRKLKSEIQHITKFAEEHNQRLIKAGVNLDKFKSSVSQLRKLFVDVINTIRLQRKMARDLRKNHQKRRDKVYNTQFHIFNEIIKTAMKLKLDVKHEDKEENLIKSLDHKIISIFHKKQLEKSDFSNIKKNFYKFSKDLNEEVNLVKKEIHNILKIDKLSTTAYFELMDEVEEVKEFLQYLKSDYYPEDLMKNLIKEFSKLTDQIKEDEQTEYYLEKYLLSYAKKEDGKIDVNLQQKTA